ncbi:uncharacterized protein JCM10292_004136 [Rhodotorula paludigena]|uniref:uncharacterized protein n=1 Tax=Rhodotorula paludigena TaxID=86838 RepID=UPI0031769F87
MPSCFVAHVRSRLNRFRGREGAIRLSLADDGLKSGDAELPFVMSGEEATKAGYTGAQLLLECILGAAWNLFCVVYLFRNPRLDPLTGAPLAPHPAFVYPLLALVCFPLAIGVVTGCAALWGEGEDETREREERSRAKEVAIWLGTVEQPYWIKLHLGVALAMFQACLVKM